LKLATTLDGNIASASGESRWITGERSRERAHLMRATNDAVMIGANTALKDDPLLTCRLPGLETRSPVRIVVDGSLRVPLTARLVSEAASVPTWFIHRHGVDAVRRQTFLDCGVDLIEVPAAEGTEIDLAAAFQELGRRGLTRVLAEGGAMLAAALLRAGLVDRLAWFHAPRLLGGDGLPAVAAFGVAVLDAAPRFRRLSLEEIGEDVLETLTRVH
jgi:diaminohydroxyphosphoribosylaminopyrimidine deaminase/5-amino-6-(5-phosphoribosylamino)uracil reductase